MPNDPNSVGVNVKPLGICPEEPNRALDVKYLRRKAANRPIVGVRSGGAVVNGDPYVAFGCRQIQAVGKLRPVESLCVSPAISAQKNNSRPCDTLGRGAFNVQE